MTLVKVDTIWLGGLGSLILIMLGIIGFFIIEDKDSKTVEHQEILNQVRYIQKDVSNIKYIIIEFHPEAVQRMYEKRGGSFEPSFNCKIYERFNCLIK